MAQGVQNLSPSGQLLESMFIDLLCSAIVHSDTMLPTHLSHTPNQDFTCLFFFFKAKCLQLLHQALRVHVKVPMKCAQVMTLNVISFPLPRAQVITFHCAIPEHPALSPVESSILLHVDLGHLRSCALPSRGCLTVAQQV